MQGNTAVTSPTKLRQLDGLTTIHPQLQPPHSICVCVPVCVCVLLQLLTRCAQLCNYSLADAPLTLFRNVNKTLLSTPKNQKPKPYYQRQCGYTLTEPLTPPPDRMEGGKERAEKMITTVRDWSREHCNHVNIAITWSNHSHNAEYFSHALKNTSRCTSAHTYSTFRLGLQIRHANFADKFRNDSSAYTSDFAITSGKSVSRSRDTPFRPVTRSRGHPRSRDRSKSPRLARLTNFLLFRFRCHAAERGYTTALVRGMVGSEVTWGSREWSLIGVEAAYRHVTFAKNTFPKNTFPKSPSHPLNCDSVAYNLHVRLCIVP